MKNKKNLKILTIIMSTIIMLSISPLFANAGNTDLKSWTFQVGAYGKSAYIASLGREKNDSSSVYIKCDGYTAGVGANGNSFQATAYGSDNPNNGFFNCTYNGKSSKTYTVSKNTYFYMINYINEANYTYANIWCYAPYNANITLTGVWSPDSNVY